MEYGVADELVADKADRRSFAREQRAAETIAALAFERGMWMLAGTGGQPDGRGDYLVLAPPLVASASDVTQAVSALGDALDAGAAVLRA